MYPGNAGGSNWGGVAVDSNRQILIANVIDMPWVVTLIPRDQVDQVRKDHPDAEIGLQEGTPYAMMRETLLSSLGLPCNKPPWGTIAAVDLSNRKNTLARAVGDRANLPQSRFQSNMARQILAVQ